MRDQGVSKGLQRHVFLKLPLEKEFDSIGVKAERQKPRESSGAFDE